MSKLGADNLPQIIGWQGLRLRVPADWTLGAVSGDFSEGYLRLDDPEASRLEIRWSKAAGAVDLDATVTRFLRQLERGHKGEPPFSSDANSRFLSHRRLGRTAAQAFTWEGERRGYGVAWFCRECGRLVIAQYLGGSGEPRAGESAAAAESAAAVLSGLEDHPRDDWLTWALFDLHTHVPRDFTLSTPELRAGLTQLSFARETEKLVVARWGMAETALAGRSLEEWAQQQLGKVLRPYQPRGASEEFRGHDSLRLTGSQESLLTLGTRLSRHLMRQRHADQLAGRVWHCPSTNRIYVVHGVLDVTSRELVDQVCERTLCHDTPPAAGR